VTPESPGDVVVLAEAKAGPKGLRATLEVPPTPGLYRLVTTLHGADDVALDASTQERIPALVVRVTGSLSAIITAPEHLAAVTGAALELPVAVLNSGAVPWGVVPEVSDPEEPGSEIPLASQPQLVGHWLRLDDSGGAGGRDVARARVEPAPGATERTMLNLVAPELPGEYLLVLDVVSPLAGSLTAAGGDPVVVRVTVEWPAPAPSTTPDAEQPAATAPSAEAAARYLP
jgi:hypothetical protein